MFKNYHIVIFKDREGGMRNLRLRGWLSLALLLVFVALAGLNFFLWSYYNSANQLQQELLQARKTIQDHDSQMLALAGKLEALESDVTRVQRFDAKLRVLTNIGIDQESTKDEDSSSSSPLHNPELLSMHRELFSRHMHSLVVELAAQVYLEEVDQQKLILAFRSNKDMLTSTPSIWPADGFLSSGFGYRRSPFTGRSQLHAGIDISNRPGTNIIAPANGVITFVGSDGAYGLVVVMDHGNNITTRFAHLRKALVKENQTIQRGDVIAHMGSSGRSTGPHLHYEVRIGNVPVNPMRYILN